MSEPTLNTLIKQVRALRDKVDDEETKLRDLRKKLETKETELLGAMNSQHLDSVVNKEARTRFTIITQEFISVEDWPQFNRYVLRNRALDLLQRRPSTTAIRERLAQGKKVPGIEHGKRRVLRMQRLQGE